MHKIYNKAVFMPKVKLPDQITLKYTKHALMAAKTDRYGHVTLPLKLITRYAEVVELETEDSVPVKLVLRIRYTETLDLVLVVVPGGTVITVWLNKVDDGHKTLRDISKFSRD